MQDVDLALPGCDERDAERVVDDGVRERDALRRGLGRVVDPRHPAVLLEQERVLWEERRGVPVRAHPEQDKVEDGEPRGVLHRELADELLLVCVGELVEIVEQRGVDRVDVLLRDGHLGEEHVRAELVVRVLVFERYGAFIRVVYMPANVKAESNPWGLLRITHIAR